jgi:hypothetical protein
MRINGRIDHDAASLLVYGVLALALVILQIRYQLIPLTKGGFGGPWTIFQKDFLQDREPLDPDAPRVIAVVLGAISILHVVLDAIF